ncbi:hypothetical protein SMD44_07545 [Streptomyces alboflavus]|uniref:Uncharacterized protein n=1 Tax=Streptomyces alboflavus TaxID=67267 RepID=A0A1Z1WNQ8_9ACTN|nr:hypothetical protein SMD44_07545 [Streptomyces alboflavus]
MVVPTRLAPTILPMLLRGRAMGITGFHSRVAQA